VPGWIASQARTQAHEHGQKRQPSLRIQRWTRAA
jgi:hypothetical protein